jgi:putative acetyltransferase
MAVEGFAFASIQIRRAETSHFDDAWELLQEYFEAVQVVVRDDRETLLKYLRDERSGVWVAYSNGKAAGCIVLRPLPAMSSADNQAGEVKRLYVRPGLRRLGIAARLLAKLETYASSICMRSLYLDSRQDMPAAVAFYRSARYADCERYNDNPEATVFLKKTLPEPIMLREFQPGDEEAFRSLNEAWIAKLFTMEEKDHQVLRQPQKYILATGGRIYMACRGEQAVGCCALLNMGNGSFEVAKMGVAESERGKGVGRAVLEYIIQQARSLGIPRLYLETNHILENAIHLYASVGFHRLRPEEVKPSPYARSDVQMEMNLV